MYAGLSILGAYHLPLYSGLAISGAFHSPQPLPSPLQSGLSTKGASHSPSSSSSQSLGGVAVASGTLSGASSSQRAGFLAAGSTIRGGASSSQSSGFFAAGSSILGESTQSSGLESVGSSMIFSGFMAGLKSLLERSEAVLTCLLSTSSLTLLSVPTIAVYRWVKPSPTSGEGGLMRCFSSHSPDRGLRWRRIKCTLLVLPQWSGPNMMVYGVSALKPSCESSSEAESSLR
mmetsp:Transcript_11573/g.23568  ORF Transcript_11573/g.23568 Transcript_11573/m.23568 type:complete len:231 (-) Transcript_11573:412-1104(-)